MIRYIQKRGTVGIAAGVAAVVFCFAVPPATAGGMIIKKGFQSTLLDREYVYTIYLPKHYENSGLRYPVLYLLHGAGGNENSWPVKGRIQPTADKLIKKGMIPPMIIVMPSHTQAWWVDGNKEKGESAFITEVIPEIDAGYRTIADRSGRIVAGLSAGGYGTTRFVLKYPHLFAAGAALSPAVYVPLPPSNSSANRHHPYQKNGAFDPETWKRLNYVNFLDSYFAQEHKVPLYINSGDHDKFDIAYHAAVLFQKLREHQPRLVEYRVIDGDHTWDIWESTIGEAMIYMAGFISRPVGQ